MEYKILVSCPTRNHPTGLKCSVEHFIKMLNETCYNKNNFDIQFIIDSDQIGMYNNVMSKNTQYIWDIVEHTPHSWLNIFKKQHDRFLQNDNYYFLIFLSDDVDDLSKHWDKNILEKVKTFEDDLFILHSQSEMWSQKLSYFRSCYITNGKVDSSSINHGFENMPIYTQKIIKIIDPLYRRDNTIHHILREKFIAYVIAFLYYLYKEHRHVESSWTWGTLDNSGTTVRAVDFLSKKFNIDILQCFIEDSKIIAKQIKEEIDRCRNEIRT